MITAGLSEHKGPFLPGRKAPVAGYLLVYVFSQPHEVGPLQQLDGVCQLCLVPLGPLHKAVGSGLGCKFPHKPGG